MFPYHLNVNMPARLIKMDSLKAYRDVKNSIDTALEKGREEGKNSMAIQIAKRMLDAGMDIETVMQITDLSKSEIEKLK